MNRKSRLQIIGEYVSPPSYQDIIDAWNEPHRVYHTQEHLNNVLNQIYLLEWQVPTDTAFQALVVAAYFHDIVYVPGNDDNEERSIDKMLEMVTDPNNDVIKLAKKIILSTKKIEKKDGIFNIFQYADCYGLIAYDLQQLLVTEDQIFKEFQRFSWGKYKGGGSSF